MLKFFSTSKARLALQEGSWGIDVGLTKDHWPKTISCSTHKCEAKKERLKRGCHSYWCHSTTNLKTTVLHVFSIFLHEFKHVAVEPLHISCNTVSYTWTNFKILWGLVSLCYFLTIQKRSVLIRNFFSCLTGALSSSNMYSSALVQLHTLY